jgi:hypothetical protein
MLHTIYGNQLVNLHLKTETYKLQLMCSIRLCVYWSCSDAKFFQSFREYITVLQTTLILKAEVFRQNKLCGFENMSLFLVHKTSLVSWDFRFLTVMSAEA